MKRFGWIIAFPLIWLATFAIHFRLIIEDPLLERDDLRIIRFLKGTDELWRLVSVGQWDKLLVYQPVRDATLFLDLWLKKVSGFGTFHFTNCVLWCVLVWVAYRILCELYGRSRLVIAVTAVFAVHPVFVNSVGWVAARKHLLSCLFILGATWVVVRYRNRGRKAWKAGLLSLALYLLSVLSHPITVLWPCWAILYARRMNGVQTAPRDLLRVAVYGLPLMIAGIVANYVYYRTLYPVHTATLKFVASKDAGIGIGLLAQGRYLFNLLAPFRLATTYYPGAVFNLLGLLLGPFVFMILLMKLKERADSLAWLGFYLFPLLPVTLVMTNIFVSDTYLLTPSVGMLVLVTGYLKEKEAEESPGFWPVVAAVFGCFLFLSVEQAKMWRSERELWARSFATEPSPRALVVHAKHLLDDGKALEARALADRLHQWDPSDDAYPYLLARAVYLDRSLSPDEKIAVLGQSDSVNPWFSYFFGTIFADAGRYEEADERFSVVFHRPLEFDEQLPLAAAEALKVCRLARASDCAERMRRLREELQKPGPLRENWDERAFRQRARSLGLVEGAGPEES